MFQVAPRRGPAGERGLRRRSASGLLLRCPRRPPIQNPERLILASNRLPVAIEEAESGSYNLRRTTGGLATGLAGPHRTTDGRWFGWPGVASEDGRLPEEVMRLLEAEGFRGVGLDQEEYRRYYLRACNRCIWPLLHGFVERVEFDPDDWDAYRRVNRRFADALLEEVRPGDLVFVHDFHLLLVPEMIRRAEPGVRIGFFLHVPFPPPSVFRVLPPRAEALRGLLGADVIGFHTLEYLRSFRSTARRVLGVDTMTHTIEHAGRRTGLMARPLGIDTSVWERPDDDPEIAAELADLAEAADGRRVILGVERLDYTKGIPERLLAFRALLTDKPELVEQVVFFQIAVPSRTDVDDYRELKVEVERLAGEINARFGRVGLQPLHYQFSGVGPARLLALYRSADICLVTPLRDGLNLVAKEFVAARRENDGVLMLSEFTGAAWELTEALKVNPYDIHGMKEVLERALAMSPEEQAQRMAPMRARVRQNDVHRWTTACLEAIRGADREERPELVDERVREALDRRFRDATRRILALDYDGTLRELEPTPQAATPSAALSALLERLGRSPGVETWIVSGRDVRFLEQHLGALPIGFVAEHGAFARFPGETEIRALFEPPAEDWKALVRPLLEDASDRLLGSLVEDKPLGIAWHYRATEPESAAWQAHELYQHLSEILADEPLEVLRGSKVIEIRPAGVTKARGLARALRREHDDRSVVAPDELLIVAGDDVTDESLFRGFPQALSILVGDRSSWASYRVPAPADLRALLAHWVELLET